MNIKDYVRLGHRLLYLIFWMIVGYIAGDAGAGFYYVAMIICQFVFLIFMGGLKETVAKMTAARVSKGFHNNAGKVFRMGLFIAILFGAITGFAFLVFGRSIMELLYGYTLPASVLGFFGIYYILVAINSCLMGYHQGMGFVGFCMIGEIVEGLLLVILSPFIVGKLYTYGTRVSALLKEPLYANLNGAIGGVLTQCIGICVSSLIVIVGIILVRKNSKVESEVRGVNNRKGFFKIYLKSSMRLLEEAAIPVLMLLSMAVIFTKAGASLLIDIKELFTGIGVFAGKFLIVMLAPFVIFLEYVNRERRKIKADFNKEEHKNIKIRAGYLIKNTLYLMLPVCATAITLAKPIVMIFFGGRMSVGVTMVRLGGIIIILAALSYASKAVLKAVELHLYGAISALAGYAAMLVFLLPSVSSGLNINLLVYSIIIYYLVQAVVSCLLVYRMVDVFVIDIGMKAAKVFIATILLIVAEAILDKFIVMNIVFLLLTLMVAYTLYFVALGVLRGINAKDVKSLKGTLSYYPSFIVGNFFDGR